MSARVEEATAELDYVESFQRTRHLFLILRADARDSYFMTILCAEAGKRHAVFKVATSASSKPSRRRHETTSQSKSAMLKQCDWVWLRQKWCNPKRPLNISTRHSSSILSAVKFPTSRVSAIPYHPRYRATITGLHYSSIGALLFRIGQRIRLRSAYLLKSYVDRKGALLRLPAPAA